MPGNNSSRQRTRALQIIRGVLLVMVGVMLALAGVYTWPRLRLRFKPAPVAAAPSKTLAIPSLTPTRTRTPTPSATPTPTSTVTSTPPLLHSFSPFNEGVIILAMDEGAYTHLFAYQAGSITFLRLTQGNWHDINPNISPDSRFVAFASDRDGHWDLYQIELASGEITRLTDSPEYDASPSWSPDRRWLVYESYVEEESGGDLELFIRPVDDSEAPIRLTFDPGADYSPAWSPKGRQIAFISTRSGQSEVWLADLDKVEDRYQNLSKNTNAIESHPIWSPDGRWLAWASTVTDNLQNLYIWDTTRPANRPRLVSGGDWAAFSPRGDAIMASLLTPNQAYLSGYSIMNTSLVLPMLPLEGNIAGITWGKVNLLDPLPARFEKAARFTPTPLWTPVIIPGADMPGGRQHLIPLEGVEAPNPMLQDRVDESFNALRKGVALEAGWDFLSTLEDAYIPLSARLGPGLSEDWLYTGRAFRFSTAPVNAGWVMILREDFGPQTYWRIFLRTRFQDGTQGAPLKNLPWNLSARHSGDPQSYEQGGAYERIIPSGYWVDFTQLAAAYGWQRQPALSTWRLAYSATRFNEFILSDGLDWLGAMEEIYPRAALDTPTPVPSPSITPIPSLTPTITLTPTATRWLSPTPSNSPTPRPTRTPRTTPTSTPSETSLPTTTPSPTVEENP
jgi:TolB protein